MQVKDNFLKDHFPSKKLSCIILHRYMYSQKIKTVWKIRSDANPSFHALSKSRRPFV